MVHRLQRSSAADGWNPPATSPPTPNRPGRFARAKRPGSDGEGHRGAQEADQLFDDGVTARVAGLPEPLEDLLCRVGMLVQPADDVRTVGIEFAGAVST
jgi:hypothetical protein